MNVHTSPEMALLDDESELVQAMESHDLTTAPLITRDAYECGQYSNKNFQYGLLGRLISIHSKTSSSIPGDPRLYLNTNSPFSSLVCGVQGSGKSHTVSVMLENMFLQNCPSAGRLQKALSGLVLHFGEGGPSSLPSEAAWLAIPKDNVASLPKVHVFVSRSSLSTMRAVYEPLGNHVIVEPLTFSESDLDAQAFLSMMAVGATDSMPLYMQIVLTILRELGEGYTYKAFKEQLDLQKKKFNPAQISGLEQRMSMLTSFLEPKGQHSRKKHRPHGLFAAGRLTIIDLSDPFIDPSSACGLFEIITRQFVRAEVGTGKVLVVDEAHKYLSATRASSGLTNTLLGLIRQQRHLAMRVIISTQEPLAVPPMLIDLCNAVFLHRFSSPSWWEHIIKHVSADFSGSDVFDQVVRLQTGQALVIAPSALSVIDNELGFPISNAKYPSQIGRKYLLMKTRQRLTHDGGESILVLKSNSI